MSSFRKLSIVFNAFLLAYFGEIAINIACGPEPDPYDYYVSYFHNNVPGDAYIPFSFTGLQFLYSDTEPESEAAINSRTWAQYLGKDVQAQDVERLMYHTNSATDSIIIGHLTAGPVALPDSLAKNTYLSALATNKKARGYYLFAKEAEPYAAVSYQGFWDPDPRSNMDMDEMYALAERAETLARKSRRDNFLQLRYAYQAARMYHYAGWYDRCIAVYDEYLAHASNDNPVHGWSLALKAGATRRVGDAATAAYLFSKVFTSSPERRVQAYKNFRYIDVPLDEVLAQTQTDNERAAVMAINAFSNADFDPEALETIYQLAPQSPLVGVVLTREVNKLESQLTQSSQYYAGGWWGNYFQTDSTQARARSHAQYVANFAKKLAAEKKYPEPGLGAVSEAYLQWLLGHVDQAETLLTAIPVNQLPERLADQYRITELLIKINRLAAGNAVQEATLLPALQWLDNKRQAEIDAVKERYNNNNYWWFGVADLRFNRTASNLYQSVLAPHYMAQKDTAMAALLMWKGEFPNETATNDSSPLFDRLGWPTQSFWHEQLQPAALEQLATWGREGINRPLAPLFAQQMSNLESDAFWDLLGTAYLRVHDYPAASKAFANLSDRFEPVPFSNWYNGDDDAIWPNPFITTLNDYPKQFGDTTFSKAQFANTMAQLQQRIQTDPAHAAKYYFELANGVYQTGAFGNAWQLISYSWTSTDNYIKGNYYYSGDFHQAKQAAKWYAKARSLSNDREFQAKCTFMLAKCAQKDYLFTSVSDYYDQYTPAYYSGEKPDPYWLFSQQNPYFKQLRDTRFSQEAIAQCTYLADFVQADMP